MAIHHIIHCQLVGLAGNPAAHVRLVLPSCLLKAATQHPGSSSPVSLLRHSPSGVVLKWMASLSNSSPGCLAMSTTVVSSHLMACWSFHACSATATSPVPLPAGFLVLPQPGFQSSGLTNVDLAATAGDSHDLGPLSIGRRSFTRVSTERSDSPDLKMTLTPYFLHTHLMSLLTPAVYSSITKIGRPRSKTKVRTREGYKIAERTGKAFLSVRIHETSQKGCNLSARIRSLQASLKSILLPEDY